MMTMWKSKKLMTAVVGISSVRLAGIVYVAPMTSRTTLLQALRDVAALCTVALFMFPILWTALDSFKPSSAVYNTSGVTLFDFVPTLQNYAMVLGQGPDVFDSRQSILDTVVVAAGATLLALAVALPASYSIWRHFDRHRVTAIRCILLFWMLPPIVLIGPLFQLYRVTGLFDTRLGLMLAEAAIHLPFAMLVLTSFFEDLLPEVAEAAMLDGATETQVFARIVLPMLHGGITATAIIFFIYCWTEYFLAVSLTAFTHTVPVQVSNMRNALGGSTMAFSTIALVPCFVFVLLVQKQLARGFSLGLQR
jgi:multiple sugar transport system permease protein